MMLFAVGVVACLVAEAAIVCALVALAACAVWRRLAKLDAVAQRYTPAQLAAARDVVERWKAARARIEKEAAQTVSRAWPGAPQTIDAIKGACSCGTQLPGDGWTHTYRGCNAPARPKES